MLVINIRELWMTESPGHLKVVACGQEMAAPGRITDAFLETEGDKIKSFGAMQDLPGIIRRESADGNNVIDATGRIVIPAFCDPHTHLVFAGSREQEFVDKIKGLTYEEIAARGGGILNSARLLRNTQEEDLFEQAMARAHEVIRMGTGSIEIKSGYGLDTESELKMLRVIRRLKQETPLNIRATFLGAHAVPDEFRGRQEEYVDHIINEMLPLVAAEELADYIDVFCDQGFFSTIDTERILMAGIKYGLRPKIHANELGHSGGILTGVKYGAVSVDHLEYTDDEDILALKNADTIPTILPGASFFLGLPLAPARKMIDAGLPLALASDYNPGSSPSGNMQFILSLGCIKYKMLPEESLTACTLNAARAMGAEEETGSIAAGKKASFIITQKLPSLAFLPYSFGVNKAAYVILNGAVVARNS